jgi:hypothetical protein
VLNLLVQAVAGNDDRGACAAGLVVAMLLATSVQSVRR